MFAGKNMNVKKRLLIANLVGFVVTILFLFCWSMFIPEYIYTFQHKPEYVNEATRSLLIGLLVFTSLLLINQIIIWRLIRKIDGPVIKH